MRKTQLANDEYYHVYNRGTDKRKIVLDAEDANRLVQSLIAFNTASSIGSIYSHYYKNKINLSSPVTKIDDPLVDIVCYCFNTNHFHFLLKQISDGGISKFMQKFGTGYTRYFNEKYERTGVLFQGKFKARHISNDADLLRMSAYVNLNNRVHQLSASNTKLVRSSWLEYTGKKNKSALCSKDIILEQFNSLETYLRFAKETTKAIARERSEVDKSEIEKVKKEFYGYYFD
ncbi:transposase [Candidatus Kaiserbacteria bacterium]|nr:MAG: transposase [Candidatus Kaiserbacteria bacterium]